MQMFRFVIMSNDNHKMSCDIIKDVMDSESATIFINF